MEFHSKYCLISTVACEESTSGVFCFVSHCKQKLDVKIYDEENEAIE